MSKAFPSRGHSGQKVRFGRWKEVLAEALGNRAEVGRRRPRFGEGWLTLA